MALNKVVWHEGMLLRPQHLQHQDRYHEHQLRTRSQRLEPHAWGFFELVLDRQFLAMGKLVVSRASGLLPDGTLFELDDAGEPLAVDVTPGTRGAPVYLALPLVTSGRIECRRAEQQNVLARFVVNEAPVVDGNAGEAEPVVVGLARPEFRLQVGEAEGAQSFVRLELCRILDSGADGALTLDSAFSPSVLDSHASPFLLACLKEVISLLAHRGDILAERVRASGRLGSAEIGDFLLLQLINRHELPLRHLLERERTHPEVLYRQLLELLGELATFSNDKRPPMDLHYQHGDQQGCFARLLDALRQLLSMVLEQHAIELPLQLRQYGIRVAPLHDRKLLGSASFVLAARADCDAESLRSRLPAHLKVGPVERIRQLVNLHLPGLTLRPLPVAPRQIPFHAGKTYFALDLDPEALAQLESSGGFAFHVSGDFAGLELQFWAIRNAPA